MGKYTFAELTEMEPPETRIIRDKVRKEYSKIIQEQHKHAAEILFYQKKIEEAQ